MMPTIAVCLPGEHFSSRWVSTWTELFGHMMQLGFGVKPLFEFTSSPYHTRNLLASQALAVEGAEYVLWLDDDNPLQPEHFDRLLKHFVFDQFEGHQGEIHAVAGWSWCEQDQYEGFGAMISCGRILKDGTSAPFAPEEICGHSELIEVGYTGFPAILMRADMLREVGPNPFAPLLSDKFSFGYSGEDFAFCVRAKAKGMRIFVDPLVQVPHLKLRAIQPTRILSRKECAA